MYSVFCKGWDYDHDCEIHGWECFDTYEDAEAFIHWCETTKNDDQAPVNIWKHSDVQILAA